ncbi:MAG: MerR family transcriptional regulator [Planctomycetota bacterium]
MLTIGDLARAAGVGISTVRHYERQGLLPARQRSQAGYRLYDDEAVQQLRFIVHLKQLGFSLKEIAGLLFLDDQADACADLNERVQAKRTDVQQRIRDLRRIDAALAGLLERCRRDPQPGSLQACPMWARMHADAVDGPVGEGD